MSVQFPPGADVRNAQLRTTSDKGKIIDRALREGDEIVHPNSTITGVKLVCRIKARKYGYKYTIRWEWDPGKLQTGQADAAIIPDSNGHVIVA